MTDDLDAIRERISHLSDAELLRIVQAEAAQYRSEALEYAKAEMEKRGLSLSQASARDSDQVSANSATNIVIGDASGRRIQATIIDNLLASFTAICAVGGLNAGLESENPVTSGLVLCLTYLAYFFFFEALWARTPGKFLRGLQVRRLDGRPCRPMTPLIRTLLRIFEKNPLLFGVTIMFSKRKQRLGDILAGTLVVSSQAIRETDLSR